MKCAIPAIEVANLQIANAATIGVQKLVSFSYDPIYKVGELLQTAVDAAALTLDMTYQPPTEATQGRDLQLVCLNAVRSASAQIVLTFGAKLAGVAAWTATDEVAVGDLRVPTVANGHFYKCTVAGITDDTQPVWPTTAGGTIVDGTATWVEAVPQITATLKASAIARDQTGNLPQGIAVDVVTPAGTTVRELLSLISITGGAQGNRYGVISVPAAESFHPVAEVKTFELKPPVGKAVGIAQRYDSAHWVVKGRADSPELTIGSPVISFGDGLARLNGHRVTVMNEITKDDRVLTQRVFVGGFRGTADFKSPDGDGEEEITIKGLLEQFAVFN